MTDFGVEDGRPADRAEPEYEARSLIADPEVFGGDAVDLEWRREAGQCRKDTACASLARQAVANAAANRFTVDLDPQLAAGAGGRSGSHARTGPASLAPSITNGASETRNTTWYQTGK